MLGRSANCDPSALASSDNTRSALQRVLDAVDRGEVLALAVVTRAPEARGALVGRKVIVRRDGAMDDATGDADLDRVIAERALELMASGKTARLEWPERGEDAVEVYVEPYAPPPSVVICGAGHIAVPLAKMAKFAGFHVTVIDDRPDYANVARFPSADAVLAEPFLDALARTPITQTTAVVLVTRGHRYDWDCLRAVIDAQAMYIGMIGSQRRVKAARLGLEREGVPSGKLDRIAAPIGLDIGSETPEEIAVAIVAEIILARRGGTGAPLARKHSAE